MGGASWAILVVIRDLSLDVSTLNQKDDQLIEPFHGPTCIPCFRVPCRVPNWHGCLVSNPNYQSILGKCSPCHLLYSPSLIQVFTRGISISSVHLLGGSVCVTVSIFHCSCGWLMWQGESDAFEEFLKRYAKSQKEPMLSRKS